MFFKNQTEVLFSGIYKYRLVKNPCQSFTWLKPVKTTFDWMAP